jgi:hypothetical protein
LNAPYNRGQKKVGQCFFANVCLLFLWLLLKYLRIYYSKPGLLNSILAKFLNKTCPTFFYPRLYVVINAYPFSIAEETLDNENLLL